MQNLHVIIVKYIGEGEYLPARTKIISEKLRQSVTLTWDSSYGRHVVDHATHWLKERGFNIIGSGEGKGHSYIITDTCEPKGAFKPLK
jgi:hypothetical protein